MRPSVLYVPCQLNSDEDQCLPGMGYEAILHLLPMLKQVITCVSFIENGRGFGIMICPVEDLISSQLASIQCWGVVKIWW